MPPQTPRFGNEKLRKYPHMFPNDIEIWERFLDKYGELYTGFDYDIKVGSGSLQAPDLTPNYARMQDILSKYRIDCVGYKGSSTYIIEVKPEASTVAIGQIIAYTNLYNLEFKPSGDLIGVIVTDREIPDMKLLTDQLKIEYYIV